jgi:capsular exopolysaccharide synthesis family protein
MTESDKTLLFTGAAGGDGVTTVATEVGRALAQMSEGGILLVDANLRRPYLHCIFDVARVPGLSDLIAGKADIQSAVHVSGIASISCLPAGTAVDDPVSLLTSTGYSDLMQKLLGLFRFIIFDSSPILQFADTAVIAPRTDGVVVVAAAGRRRRSEVREVKDVLQGLRVNLIGVVLSKKS